MSSLSEDEEQSDNSAIESEEDVEEDVDQFEAQGLDVDLVALCICTNQLFDFLTMQMVTLQNYCTINNEASDMVCIGEFGYKNFAHKAEGIVQHHYMNLSAKHGGSTAI